MNYHEHIKMIILVIIIPCINLKGFIKVGNTSVVNIEDYNSILSATDSNILYICVRVSLYAYLH